MSTVKQTPLEWSQHSYGEENQKLHVKRRRTRRIVMAAALAVVFAGGIAWLASGGVSNAGITVQALGAPPAAAQGLAAN